MTAISVPLGQILHTTDAEFRAWGTALRDMLTSLGLTKTADTGQIDWTTVLRPTSNVMAGYEIWRFNDTLQATKPIFFKLEYGSGSSTTTPGCRMSTGSGSNGAGTLTGPQVTNVVFGRAVAPAAGNSSTSYGCKLDAMGGFVVSMFTQAVAANPTAMFTFGIQRTVDDTGAPTEDGYAFYYGATSAFNYYVWSNITNSMLSSTSVAYTMVPGAVLTTSYGAEVQAYRHACSVPRLRHLPMMLTVILSEFARGTTFTTVTVGGTTRTFLALAESTIGVSVTSTAAHVLAIAYE